MSKSIKNSNKEFQVSQELETLAEKIIKDEGMEIYPSEISYLLVYPNISKTVAGRCIRTGKELKFFSGKDYLIEISGELWDTLDASARKILMEHELRHIMPVMNNKTGEWKFELRNHDIMEFSSIIKKYGINWIDKVKLSISSLYDLTPKDESKITF